MTWIYCTFISTALLAVGIFLSITVGLRRKKTKFWLSSSKVLFVTTLLSGMAWFWPYCISNANSIPSAIMTSLQSAMRMFALDGGFFDVVDVLGDAGLTPLSWAWYLLLGGALYLIAPLLTFHFILTFFKNAAAYTKFALSSKGNVHIFSELNERSLALAKSMTTKEYRRAGNRRPVIIFADIIGKCEEEHLDLVAEARHMGAILFRRDICSIFFPKHGTKSFYLICDDEAEKTRHATHIISHFKGCRKTRLYVFSDNVESKCFLDSYTPEERQSMALQVVRVNDIRSLAYHSLECNGLRLFEHANKVNDTNKEISAVIVGLGRYGKEMIKALLWYCQFPGYSVKITVIDSDENAEDRFRAACPEIKLRDQQFKSGDMKYYLDIKTAAAGTKTFADIISGLASPTYVFVCLGDDATNISTSMDIRCLLAGKGWFPDIETVVYDTTLKSRVNCECGTDKSKNDMEKFDIHVIGDLESFYSYKTVIASDLIRQGFAHHCRWDDSKHPENNFFMNDYYFFSTLSGTLHHNLRERIKALGDQKQLLFPAVYGDVNAPHPWEAPDALRSVLEQVGDLASLQAVSESMTQVADRLYSKLAELHYKKLSPEDRADALASLRKAVEGKYKSAPTPQKSKKVPPIPTELRLLQQLEDDPAHLCGIDSMLGAYLVDECDVKMCKKCQKRKKFDRCGKCGKRTKCDMALEWENVLAERNFIRKMFEHIVETQYAKQPDGTYKPAFKLGFELEALSDTEKQEVRSFIAACGVNNLDECIAMSRSFAYIEHIRWNAYMRTEGYSFCNNFTTDMKKYKLHGNLVPVDELTFEERIKDI